MGSTPMQWVESPRAEPPVVGLIASLSGPYLENDAPLHAVDQGIHYQPEQVCDAPEATDPCDPGTLTPLEQPDVVEAMPFLIWQADRCSTLGGAARNYQQRAVDALIGSESKQIAAEFWGGAQAQASGWPNRFLADNTFADVLSASPVSVSVALQCLEQALGDCGNGARGMIHCTRGLAARWSELGNVFRSPTGVIQTYLGTIVVPDAGYDGSGPDGQAATDGSQWAYATSMVTVRRGPIDLYPGSVAEATDRDTNTVTFRAQRLATVTFDGCCHASIQIDLPICLLGGVS